MAKDGLTYEQKIEILTLAQVEAVRKGTPMVETYKKMISLITDSVEV